MKISEIKPKDVADYLKLEQDEYNPVLLGAFMDAAKEYLSQETGLPVNGVSESLDSYADMTLAFFVLCSDAHEQRSMYPDAKFATLTNVTVRGIINHHRHNLV